MILSLNNLGKESRVALCSLSTHTGISSHGEVNLLTKKATTTAFVGSEPFCVIGMSTHNKELKNKKGKLFG